MLPETVFAFMYNSMTWESADAVMSLHFTEEGAKKAMEWHKNDKLKEFKERGWEGRFEFGRNECWYVKEFKIEN